MNRFGIKIGSSIRATYGLALAFILGIAFFIRVHFPFDNVFADGWVRSSGVPSFLGWLLLPEKGYAPFFLHTIRYTT